MTIKLQINGEEWSICEEFDRDNPHSDESISFWRDGEGGYWFAGVMWPCTHPSDPVLQNAVVQAWCDAKEKFDRRGALVGWHRDHVRITMSLDGGHGREIHAYYGRWEPHHLRVIPVKIRNLAESSWEKNRVAANSTEAHS